MTSLASTFVEVRTRLDAVGLDNQVREATGRASRSARIAPTLDPRGIQTGMAAGSGSITTGVAKAQRDFLGLRSYITGIGATIAGVFVADKIVGFLKGAVREANEGEKVNVKLANSVKANTLLSASAAQAFDRQSLALLNLTGVDDEAVKSSQAVLTTFRFTERQILSLTPLVLDLSKKFGIDLDTAAKMVGRTASGSGNALTRMGVVIDKTRYKSDAFGATVDALTKKAGGFAAAYGETAAGKVDIAREKFANLQQVIGEQLIPQLAKAADFTSNRVLPTLERIGSVVAAAAHAFGTLPRPLRDGIGQLAGWSAAAGLTLVTVRKLGELFPTLTRATRAQTLAVGELAAAERAQATGMFGGRLATGARGAVRLGGAAAAGGVAGAVGGSPISGALGGAALGGAVGGGWGAAIGALGGGLVGSLREKDPVLPKLLDQIAAKLPAVQKQFGLTSTEARKMAETAAQVAGQLGVDVPAAASRTIEAATRTANATRKAAVEFANVGLAAQTSTPQVQGLDQVLSAIGKRMDVQASADAVATAFRNLASTAKSGHRELTGTSDAALANRAALRQAATAVLNHIDVLRKQGATTVGAKEKLVTMASQLQATAQQTYGNRDAVNAYLGKLGLLPRQIATNVVLRGAARVAEEIANLRKVFTTVPANIVRTIAVNIAYDTNAVDRLLQLRTLGSSPARVAMTSNLPVFRAHGGPIGAGQLAMVGEQGPELLRSGTGGNVFSHRETVAMLAEAAGRRGASYTYAPTYVDRDPAGDIPRVAAALRQLELQHNP